MSEQSDTSDKPKSRKIHIDVAIPQELLLKEQEERMISSIEVTCKILNILGIVAAIVMIPLFIWSMVRIYQAW